MAPEQARAEPDMVGPPSDRYALGLIAYKLLTGAPYWTGTSVAAILAEILYEPLRPPSERHGFGPAFDAWFLRACHHDPTQRFGSAVEQVEALARSLGLPVEIQPRATSTGSMRDSLITRSEGLPMSAGSGYASVQGMPVPPPMDNNRFDSFPPPESSPPRSDRNEASLAPHGGTVPPPSPDHHGEPNGRRWRVATVFVAAAGIVALLFVVFADRAGPPMPVAASKPIAPPAEAPMAVIDPPVAPSRAAAASLVVLAADTASAATAPTPTAIDPAKAHPAPATAMVKKDPVRPVVTPHAPATRSPTRREKWMFDEAIGDQK
jgi:serine/threonine-protein kinase